MNNLLFNQIVDRKGQDLTEADVKQLENLATVYPFCQTAHLLLAKVFKDQGSSLTDMKIKTAAAYSTDRKQLKNFLLSNEEVLDSSETENQRELQEEITEPSFEESIEDGSSETIEVDNSEVEAISDVGGGSQAEEPIVESKEMSVADQVRETLEELKRSREVTGNIDEQEQKDSTPINMEEEVQVESSESVEDSQITITGESEDETKSDASQVIANEGVDELKDSERKEKSRQKKVEVEVKNYQLGEDVVDSRLGESGGSAPNSEADLILKYLENVEEKKDKSAKKKDNQKVIDAFIKNNPVISRPSKDKEEGKSVDFAKQSSVIKKQIVSENMAKIQVKQGRYKQAIEIYEQLILKKPEKKSYFVGLIEELKNKL